MNFIKKILVYIFTAVVIITIVVLYMTYKNNNGNLLLTYLDVSNQVKDSKSAVDKKIKYLEEQTSEDGNIDITLQDKGTISNIDSGRSNGEFTSKGDFTNDKGLYDDGTIKDYNPEDGSNNGSSQSNPINGGSQSNLNSVLAGSLSADEEKIYNALVTGGYGAKARAMARIAVGVSSRFDTAALAGLLSNICVEGDIGAVEHVFSRNHAYGFKLPSGGDKIKTMADIDYLLAWDSTTHSGKPKKGSCGVGPVQCSFGRRIELCKYYKQYCTSGINDANLLNAECAFAVHELLETSYGSDVEARAKTTGTSPKGWAYAFFDKYEIGTQREAHTTNADKIYGILSSL